MLDKHSLYIGAGKNLEPGSFFTGLIDDARFLKEIEHGLNCSPFEAWAVLEVVREVYFPFLDEQCVKAPPGKITLIAISADEPAGKSEIRCDLSLICSSGILARLKCSNMMTQLDLCL